MRRTVSLSQRILNKAFGKYLFYTNVITSGVLLAQGDLIQQTIVKKHDGLPLSYDLRRTCQMFGVGVIQGPINHYFYKVLDSLLPVATIKVVLIKILCDQIIASPMIITTFFIGIGLLRGDSIATINQEIRKKFLVVYSVDWILSPPAQFINFYKVNPKFRVLYLNIVTMIYDSFLAFAKFSM